jgi:hypothetical protein
VKQFADFEIAEQNLLTDIMHSFADPNATASTTQPWSACLRRSRAQPTTRTMSPCRSKGTSNC